MQNIRDNVNKIIDSIKADKVDKDKRNLYIIDNDTIKRVEKISGLQVGGCGGIVIAHKNTKFSEVYCCFKNGGVAFFDESKYVISQLKVYINHNESIFFVGKNFSCVSAQCYLYEGKGIFVDDDNQWSFGIQVRNSDAHAILDNKTGKCINHGSDVCIGKHVWIASNSTILKGVNICDNTVVGACAVVTKKYKEGNCILAGNPARVVREDVSWERSSPVKYE